MKEKVIFHISPSRLINSCHSGRIDNTTFRIIHEIRNWNIDLSKCSFPSGYHDCSVPLKKGAVGALQDVFMKHRGRACLEWKGRRIC